MRDVLPQQAARREWMFAAVREVFRRHGYQPIETPAMERTETLLGKYGEEADKLLYFVQSSGSIADGKPLEWDKALRYDLTVPLARFVVRHRNELVFPFKRYQIQNVWRGDRPQKGRYREFFQCDVDVVGSDSLAHEADLTEILYECLTALRLPAFEIRINHRGLLQGLIEQAGLGDRFGEVCVAIDKLDKIGPDGVRKELEQRGIAAEAAERLLNALAFASETPQGLLEQLSSSLAESEPGHRGVAELGQVLKFLEHRPEVLAKVRIDLTLARGLDYYTGAIFEVVAPGSGIGSISGGGRYANLTGLFGLPGVSGVGVSLGIDRIYDALEAFGVFDELEAGTAPDALFILFSDEDRARLAPLMQSLRAAGLRCEWYEDSGHKLKKQFGYADRKAFKFALLSGEEEAKNGSVKVKNLKSGEETVLQIDQAESWLIAAVRI